MSKKENIHAGITESKENKEETLVNSNTGAEKYRTEKCRVLSYNKKTKELDINFKGYGIRLSGIDDDISDFVSVRYHGEIGKPGFACKI